MFSKTSRYRKLPDIVAMDASGRSLESKSLRLLPEVSGDFEHTVEAVDRLDHLAHKYYRHSKKWWRICDANPAFLSPLALLGKTTVKTIACQLTWDGPTAPWSQLTAYLSGVVGIESAGLGSPDQPYPLTAVQDDSLLFAINSGLTADLAEAVRRQDLPTALRQALADNGLILADEIRAATDGSDRWRIADQISKRIFTVVSEEADLNVYTSTQRHSWVIVVTHNEANATLPDVIDQIAYRSRAE